VNLGSFSPTQSLLSLCRFDVNFWLRAQGNVQYWRLPEGLPPTDPFNGMYLANYGTHGPELLRLYRESVDGEEHVIAKKLTGAGWLGRTGQGLGQVTIRAVSMPIGCYKVRALCRRRARR